jgi:hypothetical protein
MYCYACSLSQARVNIVDNPEGIPEDYFHTISALYQKFSDYFKNINNITYFK